MARELEQAIARHLQTVFGSRPEIEVYENGDGDPFEVFIGKVENYPDAGFVTLSTIGVAQYPVIKEDGTEFPTRLEFIASCRKGQEDDLAEALCAAARFVAVVKGEAYPGMFLQGLIGRFRPATPVPHAFLDFPFAYEGLLDTKEFAGVRVTWLQLVPVSTEEIKFAQASTTDALRDALEAADIAWEDFDRASTR